MCGRHLPCRCTPLPPGVYHWNGTLARCCALWHYGSLSHCATVRVKVWITSPTKKSQAEQHFLLLTSQSRRPVSALLAVTSDLCAGAGAEPVSGLIQDQRLNLSQINGRDGRSSAPLPPVFALLPCLSAAR